MEESIACRHEKISCIDGENACTDCGAVFGAGHVNENMYRNGNAQLNLFVSRPLDTSNDVPVMEGVKRHFRGGMSDGRTPSCVSSDRSARAGHGRGDGRTVARRLPAPERPQNPRTSCTVETGMRGGRPAGSGVLRAPGAGGSRRQAGLAQRTETPENVAGSGWVPLTGRVRAMPDSPVPPDAGGDAARSARLAKFEQAKNHHQNVANIIHFTAVRRGTILGRILMEMLGTVPCDSVEMRKKLAEKSKSYGQALKRGRAYGLLKLDNSNVDLTRAGRLHALALYLRLSMVEMCVIAQIYFERAGFEGMRMEAHLKDGGVRIKLGIARSYMIKVYRGLVDKGYLRCKHVAPKRKYDPNVVYMDDSLFDRLHRSMPELVWAHYSLWTYGKKRPVGLEKNLQDDADRLFERVREALDDRDRHSAGAAGTP